MNASVITPVFNDIELCMDYVYAMLHYVKPPHELILVDNASTDATGFFLERIAANHPIKLLKCAENHGFGGGNNRGAQLAANEALVFVSNDVAPSGDFLTPICEALAKADLLVGPQLLAHDTGWNGFVRAGERIVIPYIAGWCVSLRKETFKAKNGWDERNFFLDYEDLDMAYWFAQNERAIMKVDVPVQHVGFGTTAARLPGERLAYTLKSRDNFCKKWGLSLA